MDIVKLAIQNARLTLSVLIFLIIAGTLAYISVPKEAEPDVAIPVIYVSLAYQGISPEDSERLLLRPVETQMKSLKGLKEMRSAAAQGGGYVLAFDVTGLAPPALRGARGFWAASTGGLVLAALSGATYGPVAALLSEMFPPRIRYSSMSIPYHIGAGYFGGFLPLISGYIVARTGDIFAGLWYTWVLLVVALVVAMWGLPGGPPRDFSDEHS